MRASILLLALALFAVPLAGAQTIDRALRGDLNTDGTTFKLGESTTATGDVEMPNGVAVVWADETPLSVAADVTGRTTSLTLYFSLTTGTVHGRFGYVDGAGAFTALSAEGTQALSAVPRSGVPVAGVVDVGTAALDIPAAAGSIPEGARPAVELTMTDSTGTNSLYTKESTLGAPGTSTATIPLPELSTLALFALGGALVAGIVVYRRK